MAKPFCSVVVKYDFYRKFLSTKLWVWRGFIFVDEMVTQNFTIQGVLLEAYCSENGLLPFLCNNGAYVNIFFYSKFFWTMKMAELGFGGLGRIFIYFMNFKIHLQIPGLCRVFSCFPIFLLHKEVFTSFLSSTPTRKHSLQ